MRNPHVSGYSHWLIKDPAQLRINNLPKPLKDKLIPYYKDNPKYADIVKALKLPADKDANFNEVCNYLIKGDEAYKGTRWEMELFNLFPELEEFYEVSD